MSKKTVKPRLVKPKKTRKPIGRSVFGGVYIGIKDGGDANTNEILYEALNGANISVEFEGKKYKGKPVNVWKVTPVFVKMLYRKQNDFKLRFIVYEEINHTLQLFLLLDPKVKKKAKQMKDFNQRIKKQREKSSVQEAPN